MSAAQFRLVSLPEVVTFTAPAVSIGSVCVPLNSSKLLMNVLFVIDTLEPVPLPELSVLKQAQIPVLYHVEFSTVLSWMFQPLLLMYVGKYVRLEKAPIA